MSFPLNRLSLDVRSGHPGAVNLISRRLLVCPKLPHNITHGLHKLGLTNDFNLDIRI